MPIMIPGFVNLADVYDKRVSDVGVERISAAVDAFLAEHRRQMDAATNLFATPTTKYKTRYRSVFRTRNQPLDEHGRAKPVKGGDVYDLELPIQSSGNAWGINWIAAQKITVSEIAEDTDAIANGDIAWMFDHLLASLYTNANWTWHDAEHGALTISPLANGDGTEYHIFSGATAGTTDNHYLAQAASIADGNDPFPAIYEELVEHPENGTNGQVIAFIPTNLKASVEALSAFHRLADPNIRVGSANDELVGSLGATVPGNVIGYHDSGVWIVEWRRLVNSYIIGVATGGNRPLAMREHVETGLRGFVQVPGPDGYTRQNYPFYEQQWARFAGFGAWNRVGALVYRIGDGSYAIPANLTAPIP